MTTFWRAAQDGVTVAVKVQPKARRAACGGRAASADGPRLRIAVLEPAEGGRANHAACDALAQALKVPASSVTLAAGAGAREKRLHVAGDAAVLASRLEAL